MYQISLFELNVHKCNYYLSGSSEKNINGLFYFAHKFKCMNCSNSLVNGGYLPNSDAKIECKTYNEYWKKIGVNKLHFERKKDGININTN